MGQINMIILTLIIRGIKWVKIRFDNVKGILDFMKVFFFIVVLIFNYSF